MARLFAIVLFCAGILCIAQASAQVPMTGAGLPKPGAAAGIALVNSVSAAYASSATTVTTTGINTSTANFLIAYVAYNAGDAPTISDLAVNTWTKLSSFNSTGVSIDTYYVNPSAFVTNASDTFTISAAGAFGAVAVAAFSGVVSSPFDKQDGATGTSASPQAATGFTPTLNNSLVMAGVTFDPGVTLSSINGGFTILQNIPSSAGINFGIGLSYLIQTTATAAQPTWTLSAGGANWATELSSFK